MTALLDTGFEVPRGEPVGDWHPARYTQTLTGTDDFTSAADGLFTLLVVVGWVTVEGPLQLDEWQRWLLRRVLETYPPDWPVEHLRGRLRYKRVVISMGRQNGKSVIGALLALFFLTRHVKGAKVGSFASIESQARIVYERLRFAIEKSPALSAQINQTATRGIKSRDGTRSYDTYPAKEDSLQGEPFTAALYDELHLGDLGLWDAIVLGQRSKPLAMLVGITTAGDDASLLLKRLYTEGAAAITAAEEVAAAAAACLASAEGIVTDEYQRLTAGDERMGFFVWESPTASFDAGYEPTEADVIAANPAIACGRIPLSDAMYDVREMWRSGPDEHGVTGRDRVIRYTFNRFVEGAADAWVSAGTFNDLGAPLEGREPAGVVWGIQRTPNWEHAAITANWREDDGTHRTRLVATINKPDQDLLERACRALAERGPCSFVAPARTLKPLMLRLRDLGHETWALAVNEEKQAAATLKGLVTAGAIIHAGDPLVRAQSSWAKVRKAEDGWMFSTTLSVGDIDALEATTAGSFIAASKTPSSGLQLF